MKKQLTTLTLLISLGYLSIAQTSLYGKVTAGDNDEELISANVVLYKNGVFKAGVSTDFDGKYSIDIDPGTYDVTVSYLGYPNHQIQGLIVTTNQANKLDIQLSDPIKLKIGISCPEYIIPLIEIDNTTSGKIELYNSIEKSPSRDIRGIIIQVPGISISRF